MPKLIHEIRVLVTESEDGTLEVTVFRPPTLSPLETMGSLTLAHLSLHEQFYEIPARYMARVEPLG